MPGPFLQRALVLATPFAALSACVLDWREPDPGAGDLLDASWEGGEGSHDGGPDAGSRDPAAPEGGSSAASDGAASAAPDASDPADAASIPEPDAGDDPCAGFCEHAGTCTAAHGQAVCACPPTWTGTRCELDVDECTGASAVCTAAYPCLNSPGGYTCAGATADFPIPQRTSQQAFAELGYTTSASGASVVDTITGLRWQRAANLAATDWQSAHDYCEALELDDYADYRLPTYFELMTTLAGDKMRLQFAYEALFPFGDPWTASEVPGTGAHALLWYWHGWPADAADEPHARCVRTEEIKFEGTPQQRFDAQGALVHDRRTGLTWLAQADATDRDFESAASFCAGLAQAGRSFRLPTFLELYSTLDLVIARADYKFAAPFIGPTGCYMTSTEAAQPRAGVTPTDRTVVTSNGAVEVTADYPLCKVRCVAIP